MDKIPIIEATIGKEVYNFSKDPGLKEIEFEKAMKENHKSFKSKIKVKPALSDVTTDRPFSGLFARKRLARNVGSDAAGLRAFLFFDHHAAAQTPTRG